MLSKNNVIEEKNKGKRKLKNLKGQSNGTDLIHTRLCMIIKLYMFMKKEMV